MLTILKIVNGGKRVSVFIMTLVLNIKNFNGSFSKYKYLLSDNRHSLNFDNIKHALIIQYENVE